MFASVPIPTQRAHAGAEITLRAKRASSYSERMQRNWLTHRKCCSLLNMLGKVRWSENGNFRDLYLSEKPLIIRLRIETTRLSRMHMCLDTTGTFPLLPPRRKRRLFTSLNQGKPHAYSPRPTFTPSNGDDQVWRFFYLHNLRSLLVLGFPLLDGKNKWRSTLLESNWSISSEPSFAAQSLLRACIPSRCGHELLWIDH